MYYVLYQNNIIIKTTTYENANIEVKNLERYPSLVNLWDLEIISEERYNEKERRLNAKTNKRKQRKNRHKITSKRPKLLEKYIKRK